MEKPLNYHSEWNCISSNILSPNLNAINKWKSCKMKMVNSFWLSNSNKGKFVVSTFYFNLRYHVTLRQHHNARTFSPVTYTMRKSQACFTPLAFYFFIFSFFVYHRRLPRDSSSHAIASLLVFLSMSLSTVSHSSCCRFCFCCCALSSWCAVLARFIWHSKGRLSARLTYIPKLPPPRTATRDSSVVVASRALSNHCFFSFSSATSTANARFRRVNDPESPAGFF